jgi:glycine dehydrogenase
VTVGDRQAAILARAAQKRINLRQLDTHTLVVALDETTTDGDVQDLIAVFTEQTTLPPATVSPLANPQSSATHQPFLTHPVFNTLPFRNGDAAVSCIGCRGP